MTADSAERPVVKRRGKQSQRAFNFTRTDPQNWKVIIRADPAIKQRYYQGLDRYKSNIDWHTGGWSWKYNQRIERVNASYLNALLDLEEAARYIAENGEGPVARALHARLEKLGLVATPPGTE